MIYQLLGSYPLIAGELSPNCWGANPQTHMSNDEITADPPPGYPYMRGKSHPALHNPSGCIIQYSTIYNIQYNAIQYTMQCNTIFRYAMQ